MSCITFLVYFKKLQQLPRTVMVFEQSAILNLGFLVIGFDDPFYPITMLFPNAISVMLSTYLTCTFYAYLFYFWMVLFHRFFKDNSSKKCTTAYRWKRILAYGFLTIGGLGSTVHTTLHLSDPAFKLKSDWEWVYDVFMVFMYMVMCTICGILGYFLYKIWKDWPVLIQRHKVCFQFSLYFLAIITLCKFFRLKISCV